MDVAAPPSRDASNGSFSFLKLPSWLAAAGRCMENDPDSFAGGAGMSRYVCLLNGGGVNTFFEVPILGIQHLKNSAYSGMFINFNLRLTTPHNRQGCFAFPLNFNNFC